MGLVDIGEWRNVSETRINIIASKIDCAERNRYRYTATFTRLGKDSIGLDCFAMVKTGVLTDMPVAQDWAQGLVLEVECKHLTSGIPLSEWQLTYLVRFLPLYVVTDILSLSWIISLDGLKRSLTLINAQKQSAEHWLIMSFHVLAYRLFYTRIRDKFWVGTISEDVTTTWRGKDSCHPASSAKWWDGWTL